MASLGIGATAVLGGSTFNSLPRRTQTRFSLPDRSVTTSPAPRLRVSANAEQCAGVPTAAKNVIQVADFRTFVDSEISTALPAALESDGIAIGGLCVDLLERIRLSDLQTREAFASSGDITEANMERLVESLLHEEGQSMEDYRQRATMFGKIADFFSQRKAYDVERDENSRMGGSEIARTMQVIVDVVLTEEGRSAIDYKCRAQLFAQSAEVFPFTAGDRSS